MVDPYCYPNTGVLINKYQIKDRAELEKVEANLTAARIRQLLTNPLPGNYDFSHFCAFHQFIFQDIFKWAGQPRTINIFKPEYQVLAGRSIIYADYRYIITRARLALSELTQTVWSELSLENQAAALSRRLAALWKVHCFREGNTRTVAIFCSQYVRSVGISLDSSLFENHSQFFRNALVAANAIFDDLGDRRQPEHLNRIIFDALKLGQGSN
ncbi:MAG: Fic family protein [Synergistaceae bacterium]|nr:Fic family protein [Synergistaceae bacterium]